MNILLISIQKNLDVIGLKYLHYYLLKNGHSSFLLFLPKFNPNDKNTLEKIKKFVLKINPQLIGISLMSVEYYYACDLTKYLKNNFNSITIVWGGIHPTIAPEMCLEYADYICIGEGERTFLDLANALSKNESINNINNLCYLENKKIKRNPLYPLIEGLDELPLCDLIPVNGFILASKRILPLNKRLFKRYAKNFGQVYNIISSRGCSFSCAYCSNSFLSRLYHSKKIRRRSISNVISELKRAVNKNPEIDFISFQDDCFLAHSSDYIKKFCKIYKERIRKPFIIRTIPTYINRDKISLLKKAGLNWIILGLQSGSERVCKEIFKRKSLKADFLKAAKIINDFNIAPFYDIILDNPFENEEDKFETIQTFIETPKPFFPKFFSLSLYFGTELYERAKKECPEKIEDSLKKDYRIYHKDTLNDMIRLSSFLSRKQMNKIISLYKQNPQAFKFKVRLFIAKLLSPFILEPITYFRVVNRAAGGSYIGTFKFIKRNYKEGFTRYLNQFRG